MFYTYTSLIKSLVNKQMIKIQTDLTQIKHIALRDTVFLITRFPCIQEYNNIHTAEILAFIDLLTCSWTSTMGLLSADMLTNNNNNIISLLCI